MSLMTPTQAAAALGITLQQLYEQFKELSSNGFGISEIGAKFNVRTMTVGQILNRLDRIQNRKANGESARKRPRDYLETQARSKYGKSLRQVLTEWIDDPTVTGPVIADRLGCDVGAVHYWLKKYDLNKLTRSESHRRTRETGRRDYTQMISAGRKTLLRRAAKGSVVAEKVYNYLQHRLLDQPFPSFDVVAGMNQWHIIPPKEVDIAVVAIRRDRQTSWGRPAYTFALEVDGELFHAERKERDAQKDESLRRSGWRPLRITVPNGCTESDLAVAVDQVFARMLKMMIDDAGLDEDELR